MTTNKQSSSKLNFTKDYEMKFFLLAILVLAFAAAGSAQNTIKIFDPIAIGASDYNVIMNSNPWGMYRSVQVYLSCPTSGKLTSTISGPNGGDFIVDNVLMLNDTNVCSGNCFSLNGDPGSYLGMPVESIYQGVRPVNVSRTITGSGLYTFSLIDAGYTYGTSSLYLTTSCAIIPINTPPQTTPTPTPTSTPTPTGDGSTVCHRDNGNSGPQTLTVGPAAVSAHLAHGDTLGACAQ
jgi:hypothetical protein